MGGNGGGMGDYGSDEWDGCCEVKNVYGSWNPAMDGVYVLVGKRWDIPSVCNSPCVYEKMNGMGGMGKPGMGGSGMQLVSHPEQFDVMVMPNMYGNIVGNICCGLVGGAGVVAGANIGDTYRVFESGTRNTGAGIAGKNIA